MKQILKRLELIKTSIAIDDEEIIELQIEKLKKLPIDLDVKEILYNLEELNYALALKNIEIYLQKYSGVVVFEDAELKALRLELKALEEQYNKLNAQKQEYLSEIEEFNTLYSIKLGGIIQQILKLKKELLKKEVEKNKQKYEEDKKVFQETKENVDEIEKTIDELKDILDEIDEDDENYDEILKTYEELQEELARLKEELKEQQEKLEDESIKDEYEEAKKYYEEFSNEYENIQEAYKDSFSLSKEEKKELKQLWKKASRLCHPDLVVDELKEQATQIMQQLNEAYNKKDLEQVRKIYISLENGIAFEMASDKIDNKEILKAKIDEIRFSIEKLTNEIEEIKEDETFKTIQNLDDWDEYFENIKTELEKELDGLKAKLQEEELI